MFLNVKNDDGHVAPFIQLPCSAITPKHGMTMGLDAGKLVKASGSSVPEFICVEERDAAVSAGDLVTVGRVEKETDYETVFSASAGSLDIGDKVTIASDGLRVTATSTNGVAEIVAMEGTASGDTVIVRF